MVMLEVRGGVVDVCPRILAPRFLLLVQVGCFGNGVDSGFCCGHGSYLVLSYSPVESS